jgi:hypothetical protein
MPRKLLFVLNPLSGGKSRKKEELPAIFENFCKENHFEFFLYKTTGHGDQKQILQICREHHLDCVVAVGGDGTVNMVGEVLVRSTGKYPCPIGNYPNGFCQWTCKRPKYSRGPGQGIASHQRISYSRDRQLKSKWQKLFSCQRLRI